MAKILRLTKKGLSNTIEGWAPSIQYGDTQIDSMADPNGGHAKRQITSIPSPFARMDLVRIAFEEVSKRDDNNNYPNIDKVSIHNRMVSDSLDVGQIFFDYERFKNEIEIIVWNRNNCLATLHDGNPGHEQVASTLELFLDRDAKINNFDDLRDIYLLKCKNGPAVLNIIGATSPRTLFFSNANNLEYVREYVKFGGDMPFDNDFCPLYERDVEYHKYLHALSGTAGFADRYPEMKSYIDACYEMSDNARKAKLRGANLQDYDDIMVGGNAGVLVSVGNLTLKQKHVDKNAIMNGSDFTILSDISDVKPLVLPVDDFTKKFNYTIDKWNPDIKVPKWDPTPLEQRTLPGDGTQYPYITIGDFFEDTFVRLPNDFNTKSFLGAGLDGYGHSALLPIKPMYFKFFTVEDLKKYLKMERHSAGMQVTLTVPVKGGSIQYTRIYCEDASPVIEKNRGELLDFAVYFAMFPNLKFPDEKYAMYRFGLIYQNTDYNGYSLHFMMGDQELNAESYQRNSSDPVMNKSLLYALDKKNFDYIQLSVNGSQNGIIVPDFAKVQGAAQFTFAIDFGTTNTHIEYSVNGSASQDFDVADRQNKERNSVPNSVQLHFLANYGDNIDVTTQFYTDMMPAYIGGEDNKYKFPMRTALSESSTINWNKTTIPYIHAGAAFTYEKIQTFNYNNVSTDLKWNNEPSNQEKVKLYIESLFTILRNRVLLGGGDLSSTKIVWFYPISMKQARFNKFDDIWQHAYQKYFGENAADNVTPMTESEAPYQYFYHAKNSVNHIVTIDIGGGTSDVVFANNGEINAITSFRFAANSIFGDGYARGNNVHTGVVRQYEPYMFELLSENNETKILSVFKSLKSSGNSADMASFMFSIKDNISNAQIRDRVDYNNLLANDDDQRMVFLVFYTSMIYHVATIMKAKGLDMPNHIAFSGNGSKVISVLTTNGRTLSDYTKLIFEKVFDKPYNEDGLTIFHNQKYPKRATCKGGILYPNKQDYKDIANKKIVLLGMDDSTFVTDQTYGDLGDATVASVVGEVKKFVQFAKDVISEFDVEGSFGVTQQSIDIAFGDNGVCYKDISAFAQKGIKNKKNESNDGEKIEETLFFYPISGILIALSDEICRGKIGNDFDY